MPSFPKEPLQENNGAWKQINTHIAPKKKVIAIIMSKKVILSNVIFFF